uniref:Uncharacterized protein n=1 Tax=Aegilops tauschii subsp. strangulata TaxID=200361 RepID=A0A453GT06_AEGTS
DELDELSASVQRIGGVGLTIHEELSGQGKDPEQPKPGDGNYFQQTRLCAETSGDGDEEGRHQGADHAHPLPGGLIHHTLRSSVLDIATYYSYSI